MSKLPNDLMSRRRLLARIALGAGLAYAAPVVAGLDLAHASTAGSSHSGGRSNGASRGGNSAPSRGNSKPSRASKPSRVSRASRGNSRGSNSRSDRADDALRILRGNTL